MPLAFRDSRLLVAGAVGAVGAVGVVGAGQKRSLSLGQKKSMNKFRISFLLSLLFTTTSLSFE